MVSRSLASGQQAQTDQREIWRDLDVKQSMFSVHSDSGAMSDIYESRSTSLDEFVESFTVGPHQIGSIFVLNDVVAGLDLFDQPLIFSKLFPKLVRGYALDALEPETQPNTDAGQGSATEFIKTIVAANMNGFPAVGMGVDHRIADKNISGGALFFDDELVHLSVFPVSENESWENQVRRS
jgi:hypothetical protein